MARTRVIAEFAVEHGSHHQQQSSSGPEEGSLGVGGDEPAGLDAVADVLAGALAEGADQRPG